MKIIAAMSGGVDSAVAAARAVEAGHEVIGVHLALASNPQKYRSGARGCCTIEDSHDARRAADKIGIPFYIWLKNFIKALLKTSSLNMQQVALQIHVCVAMRRLNLPQC
jgi:tRNA U34 2-thiouridine synthase MnmA/TrmU